MSNGWGGNRDGAGRKPKVIIHQRAVKEVEEAIKDVLPSVVSNLIALALDGSEEVTEVYQPAGVVAVGTGANPSLPFLNVQKTNKHELVLIERRVRRSGPDKAAMEYLIDRILGLRSVLAAEDQPGDQAARKGVVLYLPDNGRGPATGT